MIHRAEVMFTCDGMDCADFVPITLNLAADDILKLAGDVLCNHHHWIAKGSQHFCCKACAASRNINPTKESS